MALRDDPPADRHLRPARPRWWLWLAGVGIAAGLSVMVHGQAQRTAMAELSQRAEGTLHLTIAALQGQIQRFDRLPGLIAQDPMVGALLADPRNPDRVMAANLFLKMTANLLGATDIYVMGLDGVTIAHSDFAGEASFVGGNFGFRPYFQDALTQGAGRFFALGTTSGLRGYYFGAPVLQDDEISGVLVVKIDLDALEDSWRGRDYHVLVTDPEGIVFLSSGPQWLYGAIRARTPAEQARTIATRRYADATVHPLDLVESRASLWRLDGEGFLRRTAPMAEADWDIHVLVPARGAEVAALTRAAVAALLAGLALLGLVIVAQRRQQLAERLAMQTQAQAMLERRVAERTAELGAMNLRLEAEVSERRATEARLRATQTELVQAGKLAALGQMSAALSHEFNQPLGAARNFAENAETLIARGRIDEARANLGRILGLIDRMADLSRHLRNFARKPNTQLSDVDLSAALDAALEIVGWRLSAREVTLHRDVAPLKVRAGPVRLQQVLVNILSNAMDAMETGPRREITIAARAEGDRAILTIADTGPGIAPSLTERIFDPFFSTKGVGKGLGLGLSISYNIVHDFDGMLSAGNAEEGGAVFTIDLPLSRPLAQAAE